MKQMKKKQSKSTAPRSALPKGQKLPHARLRHLVQELLLAQPTRRWAARQIIKELKIANSKSDVIQILDGMVKQQQAKLVEEGVYSVSGTKAPAAARKAGRQGRSSAAPTGVVHEGKVDMTRSGAAYIQVDGPDDDIYVPARSTAGAMHRDIVKVELVSDRRGRKPEGRVTGVVKRALEQAMGTLKQFKKF